MTPAGCSLVNVSSLSGFPSSLRPLGHLPVEAACVTSQAQNSTPALHSRFFRVTRFPLVFHLR